MIADMTGKKILIFAPEGDIHPHVRASAFVGRSLIDAGCTVSLVYCDGLFDRCVPKMAHRTTPGRERSRYTGMCARCIDYCADVARYYELPILDLTRYLTPELEGEVRADIEAFPGPLTDYVHDGIAFGELGAADLFLVMKLMPGRPLEPRAEVMLRELILTTTFAYRGLKRGLAAEGFTDVIVYNPYAVNCGAMLAAHRLGLGVRVLSNPLMNGIDQRFVMAHPFSLAANRMGSLLWRWREWRRCALSRDEIGRAADDVVHRFTGGNAHVYSPKLTLSVDSRAELGLRSNRRTIVAFTSSADELYAIQGMERGLYGAAAPTPPGVFPDQLSWIQDMIEHARGRDDLQLVIRIHPREDANKRDGCRSQHLDMLLEVCADHPENVLVVLPNEAISSYDLMEIADLVVTAWSTIGTEAALAGIPVLSPLLSLAACAPAGEFQFQPASHAEYRRSLDAFLSRPADVEAISYAYRWHFHANMAACVDFRDVLSEAAPASLPPYRRSDSLGDLVEAMFGQTSIQDVALERRLAATDHIGMAEVERAEIRVQARRLIALLFGEDWRGDYDLVLLRAGEEAPGARAGVAFLERDGGFCRWRHGSRDIRRYSPLVARLATVAATREGASA